MALKAKIAKLDEVAEPLRAFYVEKDGAFILDAEGLVPKERLDEFRENNLALKKAQEELVKKYEGIDPALVKDLMKKQQELEDAKLLKAGDVDKLVESRTAAMKADYEAKLTKATGDLTSTKSHLERILVDSALQTEAAKAGVKVTAIDDVVLRGKARYTVQDGKVVPMENGSVVFGADGITPQPISEWLKNLAPKAPHLFEPSGGGGASNKGGSAAGSKVVTREQFKAMDSTEQAKTALDKTVQIVD